MDYVHTEPENLLIRSRYELSVVTKKFRIDLKGCNIDFFFKFVLNLAWNEGSRKKSVQNFVPNRQDVTKSLSLQI